jgi:hypothetical protein
MPMIAKIMRKLKSLKKRISRRHSENPEENEDAVKKKEG